MSFATPESYGLETQPFDVDEFMTLMGDRLIDGGLFDIAETMVAEGDSSSFVTNPLSPEAKNKINAGETEEIGANAAVFRDRVAVVEVDDTRERLVNLKVVDMEDGTTPYWTFSNTPFNDYAGEHAGKSRLFWARESIAGSITNVEAVLEGAGYALHFQDAFRPVAVQQGLFRKRIEISRQLLPDVAIDKIIGEARSKTAFTPRFAAHMGGAALDVMVRDLHSGELLDFGHNYAEGGAVVALNSPYVTQTQWAARKLLQVCATSNGFSMYPFEDWHLSIGDTTAAALGDDLKTKARYGPIKSFDAETGEIHEIFTESELDVEFDAGIGV